MNLSIATSPRVPFGVNNINITNGLSSVQKSPTKRAERQTNFKVVIRVNIYTY